MMKRWEIAVMVLGSAALLLGTWTKLLPLGLTETLGFVTGAVGVWLTVKENIWNWPIGIANSAFFVVLFFGARLFADMSLQVIYIILGFLGWYWWLSGHQLEGAQGIYEYQTKSAMQRMVLEELRPRDGETIPLPDYCRG